MAAAYEGLADVTISAEYFSAEAVKSENPQVSIALTNMGVGLVQLRFFGRLIAPENATYVYVVLPNGLSFSGEILQGERLADGGWFSFRTG